MRGHEDRTRKPGGRAGETAGERPWRLNRFRGEWAIVWDEWHDGARHRRRYKLGTKDAAEAERLAPARYAELTRPKGTTVADLWAAYCADRQGRPITETMRHTWKALAPHFGTTEGEDVSTAQCRAYADARRDQGRSDGSIHTELGHLATVLNWAGRQRLIDRTPFVERPPKPAPKEDYLTREEVGRMLAADLMPHVRLAIIVLIATGARVTAALELTWDRVDFERGQVNLRNPFDRGRRKGRAIVAMNRQLRAALAEARDNARTPFVIEYAGRPVASIKRSLHRAGTLIGRDDVSAHMFRHSAAVWLAEDGHRMDEIAQFLGHTNPAVTYRVYARYSPGHLATLARSLEV